MKVLLNRMSMYPEPVWKLNSPDRRNMTDIQNTAVSNNKMSLVSLRNKQMNDIVDVISFSGLVNR
ncbi:MAG TPA: hypothetical protein DDW90_11485 [Cyanobacteria bacterium UBA9971]|nr:hypothetical protein [Cyanobacteria bacterium UBA9971]